MSFQRYRESNRKLLHLYVRTDVLLRSPRNFVYPTKGCNTLVSGVITMALNGHLLNSGRISIIFLCIKFIRGSNARSLVLIYDVKIKEQVKKICISIFIIKLLKNTFMVVIVMCGPIHCP